MILPDGRNLDHELVRAGYAWWFRNYAPHDRELEQLEKEEREAKRGLWSDPHAIPPWEYRKALKNRTKAARERDRDDDPTPERRHSGTLGLALLFG